MYLEDMLSSINRIEEYLEGIELTGFEDNQMLIDAVVRNFEIIGEASKNIPEEVKDNYPEVPWKKMYGLRNLISHEYFGIDNEMLYHIAKHNLPNDKNEIIKIIKKEK